MDLTFSVDETAFRDEIRTWLAENIPTESWAPMDTEEGFEQHRGWERTLFDAGWSVPELARAVRRTRVQPHRVADLRGGVLPLRCARAGQHQRHHPAGSDAVRVRHPRAAGPILPADGVGRRDLGPGLVRARLRQRSRQPQDHRRARRRPLRGQRPEDLVLTGRLGRLDLLHRAHRSRQRAPSRPQLSARAGRRAGPDPSRGVAPRRRARVRRALLRRLSGAGERPVGRGGRRLERGHGDRQQRARPQPAGAGPVPGGGVPARRPLPTAPRPTASTSATRCATGWSTP